jgi:hypothetical protein
MKKNLYFANFLFYSCLIACGKSPQADLDDEDKIIVEKVVSEYPLAVHTIEKIKEKKIIRILKKQLIRHLKKNNSILNDEEEKIQETKELFFFITHDSDPDYFPLTMEKNLERITNFDSFKKILVDVKNFPPLQQLTEGKKLMIAFGIWENGYLGNLNYESKKAEISARIEKLKIKNEDPDYLVERKIKKALIEKEEENV